MGYIINVYIFFIILGYVIIIAESLLKNNIKVFNFRFIFNRNRFYMGRDLWWWNKVVIRALK